MYEFKDDKNNNIPEDVRIARKKMITALILYVSSNCIIVGVLFLLFKIHFALAWGMIVVIAVIHFLYQRKVRNDLIGEDWKRRGR